MSIVIAAQPHFINQPMERDDILGIIRIRISVGDYVEETDEGDCTGEEMLTELSIICIWSDHIDEIMADGQRYSMYDAHVDAQFQPRKMTDRPNVVVPEGSTNLATTNKRL